MTAHRTFPDRPLHSSTVGSGPRRLAFVHGLMGRGGNFTGIAKALEEDFTSELIDMPDHGRSPWTQGVDYRSIGDTLAEHLKAVAGGDEPWDVVGHSMGGKAVMALALRHPELVRRLVVVDISPRNAPSSTGEFTHLLGALDGLDLDALHTRADADEALALSVPSERVRGFLLQNLQRRAGAFAWQPNLPLLRRDLDVIGGFPAPMVDQDPGRQFTKPTLWLGGADSDYITDADVPGMKALFPRAVRVMLRGANHWVHADQPAAFVNALRTFLLKD